MKSKLCLAAPIASVDKLKPARYQTYAWPLRCGPAQLIPDLLHDIDVDVMYLNNALSEGWCAQDRCVSRLHSLVRLIMKRCSQLGPSRTLHDYSLPLAICVHIGRASARVPDAYRVHKVCFHYASARSSFILALSLLLCPLLACRATMYTYAIEE